MATTGIKRYLFATLGVGCVGLAAVGAVLPGIPTVGPLILASFFLTKSWPALEKRLIRNRLFASYLHYLDGTNVMPLKTRLASIATMWISIAVSGAAIYYSGRSVFWLISTLVIAGVIGTIFIWRFRRDRVICDQEAQNESE